MPTTLRDYLDSLPAAAGTLDTDDKVAALEDGALVSATPSQLGAGGGGAPSGPAGGVLSGTYPDPGFAADMATQAELDAVAAAKANVSHTHAATAITYAGGTGMSATDVEAAIDELATEKANAADYIAKTLADANSVLYAVTDNTPAALAVAASRIVGRKASGDVAAMTGTETAALFPAASETQASVVELATAAETGTGTDTARAVHPAGGAATYARVYFHSGGTYGAPIGGRIFIGTEDPIADGFTPANGDIWEDTTP